MAGDKKEISEKILPWEKDYPNYKTWSSHRWAWEFLRRNKEFINDCKSLDSLNCFDRKEKEEEIAKKYGLEKFKYYSDVSRPSPVFLMRSIESWQNDSKKTFEEDVVVKIKKGQLLILFNVDQTLGGISELEAQLDQARKELNYYRDEILEKYGGSASVNKNYSASKPKKKMWSKNYLRHLKIIDDREAGRGWAEIAIDVFPDGVKDDAGIPLDNNEIISKYYKMMKASIDKPMDYRKVIEKKEEINLVNRIVENKKYNKKLKKVLESVEANK